MLEIMNLMDTCNPVYGCNINCPYCYTRRLNQRFKITSDFNVPTKMPQALKRFIQELLKHFL